MTQNFKTLFYDGEDKKILVFREEDRNILFMPNYIGWEESDKQLPDIIKEIFDARKPFNNLIISFLIGNSIITYSSDEYTITDLRETISSVLGRNIDNLTIAGKCLVWLLNTIEKDHVQKAIGE